MLPQNGTERRELQKSVCTDVPLGLILEQQSCDDRLGRDMGWMEKCAGRSCPYGRDDQGGEVLWPCQLPASYVSHGMGLDLYPN